MKGLLIALAMVATSFSVSFAAETPTEDIILYTADINDKIIHLRLANLQQNTTLLTIQNMSGEVLFEEKITNHNGYAKAIDLGVLSSGRYLVHVNQKEKKLVKVMVIDGNKIWFSKTAEK